MRALGAQGLNLSPGIDEEHFGIKALYIDFLLEAGLQVERGDARDFVLLRHGSYCCTTEIVGSDNIAGCQLLGVMYC